VNTQDRPTDMGINRTGIALSPLDGPATVEGAMAGLPSSTGSARALAEIRTEMARTSGPVGHMPPPVSLRGVANTAVEMVKGNKPTVLLDKLGERLAFERTGVRLFDGLIAKFAASGSWEGGPTLEELVQFRGEEAEHMALVKEVLEGLGADPTAMTPSADLVGVEGVGVLQAVNDPRNQLPQALHAHLIAELTDVAGWELLITLAEGLGHEEMGLRFRAALAHEIHHRESVTRWLAWHAEIAAKGEPK
jgi:hypothetical protein